MAKTKKPAKKAGQSARRKTRAAEPTKKLIAKAAKTAPDEKPLSPRQRNVVTPPSEPAKTTAPAKPPETAKTLERAKAAEPAKTTGLSEAAGEAEAAGPCKGAGLSKTSDPVKPAGNRAPSPEAGSKKPRISPKEPGARPRELTTGAKPPVEEIPAGVSEASLPLQTFAIEVQKMARQSIEQTTDVMERLREAKSVEDVVSLQTTFMQQSFRRYTEFAGRIGELMSASHASFVQQGQAAMRSFRSIATRTNH